MQGYLLTFYTQMGRRHGLRSIAEWTLREAKKLGVKGATVRLAQGGFGRDGEYQRPGMFSLSGRPIEVTMAVSREEADKLFALMEESELKVFYMKVPVEYGVTGDNSTEQEGDPR